MFEFIAALIVITFAFLAMSIRFLASGRHFKRSCGRITNLKKLVGFTSCDLCMHNTPECRRRSPPSAD